MAENISLWSREDITYQPLKLLLRINCSKLSFSYLISATLAVLLVTGEIRSVFFAAVTLTALQL